MVITDNAQRYSISALCEILGVARATYYRKRDQIKADPKPDPLENEVITEYHKSHGIYGARRIKGALNRRGIVASRRRIGHIMKKNQLVSAYTKKKYKKPNEVLRNSQDPNILNRCFNGYTPHSHIASDLTYVKIAGKWNYICLLIDLANREIAGHAAGSHKDAQLVKSSFATQNFPLTDIDVFHSDRGSEFDNQEIDVMLDVFDIKRSLSRKGNPYDNAVVEATNKTLKTEFIYRSSFVDLADLRQQLNSYVSWYNNERLHSTLGYLTPAEYRKKNL